MAATLQAQQKCFLRAYKQQENATAASYKVALLIAQHGKPFTDGTFIKQCLTKVAGIMCPEKLQDIKNVSRSRDTVVRRIEDLPASIEDLSHCRIVASKTCQLASKTCRIVALSHCRIEDLPASIKDLSHCRIVASSHCCIVASKTCQLA